MTDKEAHPFQLKTVDQISFAVKDIDRVIEAWSAMYGFGPWTFSETSGTDGKGRPWKAKMAFTYLGPVQIELVQPAEGRIFQSRFIDTWGEGLHHLGFYVDDLAGEVDNLVSKGAKILIQVPGRFAYLDSGGPGGAIFELMQRR